MEMRQIFQQMFVDITPGRRLPAAKAPHSWEGGLPSRSFTSSRKQGEILETQTLGNGLEVGGVGAALDHPQVAGQLLLLDQLGGEEARVRLHLLGKVVPGVAEGLRQPLDGDRRQRPQGAEAKVDPHLVRDPVHPGGKFLSEGIPPLQWQGLGQTLGPLQGLGEVGALTHEGSYPSALRAPTCPPAAAR